MGFILVPGVPNDLAFLKAYPCESMAINYQLMVIVTLKLFASFSIFSSQLGH